MIPCCNPCKNYCRTSRHFVNSLGVFFLTWMNLSLAVKTIILLYKAWVVKFQVLGPIGYLEFYCWIDFEFALIKKKKIRELDLESCSLIGLPFENDCKYKIFVSTHLPRKFFQTAIQWESRILNPALLFSFFNECKFKIDPTIKLQISATSKDLKLHNPSLVKKYNSLHC